MKFRFPNGEEVTLPLGHKLVGFIRNGRRPISVTFDRAELLHLKKNYSYHRMIEQSLELVGKELEEELQKQDYAQKALRTQ